MIVDYFDGLVEKYDSDKKCGFCWNFVYARKDYANLEILTETNKCCVHFILEEYKLTTNVDTEGDVRNWSYYFKVFIGLNSEFDTQVHNELNPLNVISEGKYQKYIEVVEKCIVQNFHNDTCSNPFTKLGAWSFEPKINNYDNNFDGGYLTGTLIFDNKDNL